MKYVSNHVTKFEKHGDLEKPYKDDRIRKWTTWVVKEIVKNLHIIGQNKENNFIFFYKPPKSKKIIRIQCITLLLHLSEYCAELKSYLYIL